MLSGTSSFISPYRDLYFTLSTPLAAWKLKELSAAESTSFFLNKESPASIADRIQEINVLKNIYLSKQSNAILRNISFYFFSNKINACFSDLLQETHTKGLSLEVAQKVYLLAQDLKRHVSNRSTLWNALPKMQRNFLHHLSLGSEDLQILKAPIHYQWLGDGDNARVKQDEVTVTDFGDGRLFQVNPPSNLTETSVEFSLARYPGLNLVKASAEKKQFSHVQFITSEKQLNRAVIGRLSEIFDVDHLEEKMQKEEENAILYHNQLADLFACYRSALCSVLGISVRLPLGIGRQGEWVIWNHPKEKWKKQPLSSSMVADLYCLLQVEKIWKINVLNDSFAVCNNHLVVDGIYPLPTFLTPDIQTIHQEFIQKLDTDVQRQLQIVSKEEEREASIAYWLHLLVNRKSLSLQDLMNLDAQALLVVRLLHLIDQKVAFQSPLSPSLFYDNASQMLFHLIAPSSGPYSIKQRDEKKAERFTDLILNSKEELKRLMLLFAVEKFEKQASAEDCIQTLIHTLREKCHEIAAELECRFSQNWTQQESVQEHFMLLFGNDLLAELDQILHQPSDSLKHLYDQLALLREAVTYPQIDRPTVNHVLRSVLHDAMEKKYSHAFLADMQLIIKSANLVQDDN